MGTNAVMDANQAENPTLTAKAIMDANEAASFVAYKASEVIAIYPITPSSPMGEFADQWAAEKKVNLWGAIPMVQEMQSSGTFGAIAASMPVPESSRTLRPETSRQAWTHRRQSTHLSSEYLISAVA